MKTRKLIINPDYLCSLLQTGATLNATVSTGLPSDAQIVNASMDWWNLLDPKIVLTIASSEFSDSDPDEIVITLTGET